MAVKLTNPMTGTSKVLGPDEDESTYRMLGWHDAIEQPGQDGGDEAQAPTPEPVPDANEGDDPAKPKPKKSAEAPPPEETRRPLSEPWPAPTSQYRSPRRPGSTPPTRRSRPAAATARRSTPVNPSSVLHVKNATGGSSATITFVTPGAPGGLGASPTRLGDHPSRTPATEFFDVSDSVFRQADGKVYVDCDVAVTAAALGSAG